MGRLSGVLTVINIVLYLFLLFLGDGSRTAFAMLAVEFVVGFDDTLDEFVADNVLFLEFDFADSLYAFQDLIHMHPWVPMIYFRSSSADH